MLLLLIIPFSFAIDIPNEIIDEPEIQCGPDSVELQFQTKNPFEGKVYVKGHYAVPECKIDYSESGNRRPTGGIVVKHGNCDLNRQRMLAPDNGMQFSCVIVVSFHPTFITKVDRAFSIKCMYREQSKTVSTGIEVSQLVTEAISVNYPMPVCTYTIRRDEIDGEILQYARVGQLVVHRWECDSDVYGILVHSCVVDDGQGERVQVVDDRGCHIDEFVLGDPTYVENLNMAYRESHVIKFADRVSVRFQCQIRLCIKDGNGCQGITPPICRQRLPLSRPASSLSLNSSETSIEVTLRPNRRRFHRSINENFATVDGDFQSNTLYVLDTTESPDQGAEKGESALKKLLNNGDGNIVSDIGTRESQRVCFSTPSFLILMTVATCIFFVATIVAVVIFRRRFFTKSKLITAASLAPSPYYANSQPCTDSKNSEYSC